MSIDKLIAAATEYFELAAARERRYAEAEIPAVIASVKAEGSEPKKPAVKKPAPQVKTLVDNDNDFDTIGPKVEAPAPAPAPAAAPAPVEPKPDAPIPSYDDEIRPLIRTVSMTKRAELIALLGEFGCKVGADLKVEQYTAFLAALKAL
jgi:2-oxoglutarate dehydrogenase E2 component (dihydrolipoamide succinyltransferase)